MSFLSILVGFLVVLPAVLAISNDKADHKNRLFFGLSLSLSLWIIFNTIVDMFDPMALLFTKLTFVAITLGAVILLDFTHNFPVKNRPSFPRKFAYGLAATLCVIELTNLFIPDVKFENGVANVVPGQLYFLFIIYYLAFLVLAIGRLLMNYRRSRGIDRERTKMVLLAMLLMSLWASTTNLILPLFTGNNLFAPIGPYGTLLFTSLVGYAMLKHRLFDVRAAIARAVTYAITIGVLVFIYLFTFFIVAELLDGRELSGGGERTLLIFLLLLSAVSFQPLKNLFDKLTSKVFFRGEYDPQEMLDRLSEAISSTSKLNEVTEKSIQIIQQYLKSEEVGVGIVRSTNPLEVTIVSTSRRGIGQEEVVEIAALLKDHTENIIYIDEVTDRVLKRYLKNNRLEVLVALGVGDQRIGYIGLSGKSSGKTYSQKDLKVLDIAAGEMAVAFQNSLRYDEIEQFNITLQEEIEDATKQLRRTNEKLKALDETKDEFISMASHQLRTPLTSVKGYLSMVLEGDAGKITPAQEKLLKQAFTSSQRMVYLISDLLNVSRLRTGKFVIETAPTNLPEVVESELDQLHETAAARGLKLIYKKPKDFPVLNLDETKIRQVIMNFVDNAIYYTPSGGEVKIELEAKPSAVELRVTDSGIGVPKAKQHQLFSKFYRADNAKRMRPDGTGLGLFMAKKVVIAQGGAIIFKSTEGKGSTFGFTFPRHKLEVKTA